MGRPLTGRRRSVAAAFRRRAEHRTLRANELLLQPLEGALFSGLRRPLRHVLDRLDQDKHRIERAWRSLLHRLEPSPDEHDKLAALDLGACYQQLSLGGRAGSATGDEAYRLAIERGARTLVRTAVPEDHALAAVGLYLEACLRYLDRPAEARALIRLTAATQGVVAAGYREERVAGLRRLDDRERQKLSGDLHDEVGADLVVLKLYVEMIAVELAKGSVAPVGPKLQEALALIAHAVESVRRLTLDLGPAFLETLGFRAALRSFVRQFSLRTGIKVDLQETDAPIAMPASHETAVYRVLRGALSNVAKHSKARRVTVTLRGTPEVFVMIVEDDGKGFDVRAQGRDRSFGLTAMRERIRDLRGRLSIESRNTGRRGGKSGTRIAVRLPLRRRAES
jgi:signal transduction histidine kinase